MFKMAIILAALIGGERDLVATNADAALPLPGFRGYLFDTGWTFLKKLSATSILCESRGADFFDGTGKRDFAVFVTGEPGKLVEHKEKVQYAVTGLPAGFLDQPDWQDKIVYLRLIHTGRIPVSYPNLRNKDGTVQELSHQAWLDREALAARNKAAAEKRKMEDAEAERREKACEAEISLIDKTLKALAVSAGNLNKGDDFARKQARLGVDRNTSKLEKSLATLVVNGCPDATLDEIKAKVGKAIAGAKAAAK